MKAPKHRWAFKRYIKPNSFSWKSSSLARKRLKEALSEIKKVTKTDSRIAAYGIVDLAERIWPSFQDIDTSSGALGTAVHNTLSSCVPIFSAASLGEEERNTLLEKLFEAIQDDGVDYLGILGEQWGELCQSEEIASRWADDLLGTLRACWEDDKPGGYFSGTTACLSSLLKSGRHKDLDEILEICPVKMWHYCKFRFRSLITQGKKAEAMRYAQELVDEINAPVGQIYEACEEILLSSGLYEEAYQKFGLLWTERNSHLATFRAIAKKYPQIEKKRILQDLVNEHAGNEGKWFATAKELGEFEFAIELANKSPCDPKTLSSAAEKYADSNPDFAMNSGITAIRWLCDGYGYEITNFDVVDAFRFTLVAAELLGRKDETLNQITKYISQAHSSFVEESLAHLLKEHQK